MIRQINLDLCTDCGQCVEVCPMDVIRMVENKAVVKYPEDCMTCYNCELECSQQAIEIGPERARAVPLPW